MKTFKTIVLMLTGLSYLLAIIYYGTQLTGIFRIGEQTSNTQIIENLKLLLSNKVFIITFPIFAILTIILISVIVSLIIQKTTTSVQVTHLTVDDKIKLIKTYFYYTGSFVAMFLVFFLICRFQGCITAGMLESQTTQNTSPK